MVGRGFCYLEQSGLHICMSVLLPKYVLLGRRMGPVVFMNPDQESFCTKDHCNQMAISIYNSVSLLKDILVIGLIDRNWSWGQEGCIMGPYLCCLYPFSCESHTVLASSFIVPTSHSHTPSNIWLKKINAFGVSCYPLFFWIKVVKCVFGLG